VGVDRSWWAFWSSKPASGAKPPRWVRFPHAPAKIHLKFSCDKNIYYAKKKAIAFFQTEDKVYIF